VWLWVGLNSYLSLRDIRHQGCCSCHPACFILHDLYTWLWYKVDLTIISSEINLF
jgi:hypothetical protein